MPVPKKRLGSAAQNSRRANWKAKQPLVAHCTNCGSPRLPHTICGTCGFYDGKIVSYRFAKKSGFGAPQE
jgi:large subunit ribosomal protein L32